MKRQTMMTCIMCPMGCQLTVTEDKNKVSVTGNTCVRGENYAKEEITDPKRIVTALVKTLDGVLPVKTTKPIPKSMIFEVVFTINNIVLKQGKMGDVVIKNVLGLDADVVITGNKVEEQF